MAPRTSPGARLVGVGLVVLALLAVVALASRGGLGGGGGGADPSAMLLDYGFTIFLILYVIAIPFTIWAYFVRGRESRAAHGGKRGSGLLQNLIVAAALIALAFLFVALRHSRVDFSQLKVPPGLAGRAKRPPAGVTRREPRFQWPVLLAVGALGVAGVAAYVVYRRRQPALRARATLGEELAFALDDAIDDVEAETDPRRAVIKAYARMEQIFGAHGLPRRAEEAPYEYLARALEAVDASAGAARRLTSLYQRARFSQHEIDPTMRGDAIEALTSVRDELRETSR